MKRIPLGNSQLSVSRICMGCMGFGDANNGQHSWTVDEEQTRAIIKRGLELGINFFDTAIAYQSGTSEQYLGRALKDFAKRDEVVVATKFLPRTQEEIEAGVTGQQHIERMLNTSLKNLGMDYVDLYIYHMWDYQTPLYDILDGLNRVVKAGKARYIGISNCLAYQLAKANDLAREEGFEGIGELFDQISKIEVLSHGETAGVSDPAFETIPDAIIAAQSTEVDAAAGATFSSKGIMEAVNDALSKIGT